MILLFALAGAAVAAGLMLAFRGLFGRAPDPGKPPGVLASQQVTPAARRRALLAIAAGVVVFLLTRWPVAALVAVLAVIFLPRLNLGTSRARQRTAVLEGLEQWIRRLADLVTASRGLEDALGASARSAPAAIAGPVQTLAARLASRTGTEAALRAFAAEIDDPAGDRIAAALIIATGRRGGAARTVLVALAELLARDVAGRREIEAERAEHRTTVKWISFFVAGFTIFAILNRSYSAPFGTVTGQFVLAVVAGLYAVGLFWLNRLGSMQAPGRFLDDSRTGLAALPGSPAPLPRAATVEPGRSR